MYIIPGFIIDEIIAEDKKKSSKKFKFNSVPGFVWNYVTGFKYLSCLKLSKYL
jgi:hypothetical protein